MLIGQKCAVYSLIINYLLIRQEINEIDITGECKTNYEIVGHPDDDTTTITRTKSSESCRRLPISSYTTLPIALQRMPLLTVDQRCTQKIVGGIMQDVKCDESLVLRPVSGSDGGATTAIETILALAEIKIGVQSAGNT